VNDSQEENSGEYSQTFNEDVDGIIEGEEKKEINLDDYKEIHDTEKEKFQTKVNFFETSEDNYVVNQKSQIQHVVNLNPIKIVNNQEQPLPTMYKPDPKDRLPRDITANNINKLNQIYDKYNINKKQNKNTFNDEESGDFMESINNFNNNLRPYEQSQLGSEYRPSNPKRENSYILNTNDNVMITDLSEKNKSGKYIKYNPINDLNNEDSLIKDLTKFTKFALNEINQSE
jgi:hypothetical protein